MQDLSREEIVRIRDLGAVAYLRGYVRLMARELGIDESDSDGLDAMVVEMVEPLNVATEAAWRALMKDKPEDMEKVVARFKESLDQIGKGPDADAAR
jgi:hypothetical protein